MWRKILIVCTLAVMPWPGMAAPEPAPAMAESRRLALVIGNGDYPHAPLGAPAGDARAVGQRLAALGFEVVRVDQASRQGMRRAIREFEQRLAAGGVGLFYFAGHGLQAAGRTLLLPIDADSRLPGHLPAAGIDLQLVLDSMAAPRPGKLNLLILDTCLSPPFAPGERGAAPLPEQTLIAYATAPGSGAGEGAQHGLYTAALLNAMNAGDDLEALLSRVQATVRLASHGQQVPWHASSLSGGFSFGDAGQPALALAAVSAGETARSRGILPKDSAEQYELAFWDSIKDSTHVSDYEAYLQTYPNGRFAGLARARIERLRAAAPKAPTPPARPPASPTPATKAAPERVLPPPAPAPAKTAPPPAAPKPSTERAGLKELKDCPDCPTLIALPAGAFTMGSNADDPSEKPAHPVTIGAPFALGKYEVSLEQWNACVAADACPRIASAGNLPATTPVRDVSWEDAQQYVKWLSKTSGKSYRLPSEAEWEYAARGGTSTRYWWGEQLRPGNANCKGCGEPWQAAGPAPAGSFAANPYGFHDMNGSVWEWVSDCWHNTYQGAPTDGRTWDSPNCRVRVIRGGSWRDGAAYMLSSTRFKYDANIRHSQNGFRVARDLP